MCFLYKLKDSESRSGDRTVTSMQRYAKADSLPAALFLFRCAWTVGCSHKKLSWPFWAGLAESLAALCQCQARWNAGIHRFAALVVPFEANLRPKIEGSAGSCPPWSCGTWPIPMRTS